MTATKPTWSRRRNKEGAIVKNLRKKPVYYMNGGMANAIVIMHKEEYDEAGCECPIQPSQGLGACLKSINMKEELLKR